MLQQITLTRLSMKSSMPVVLRLKNQVGIGVLLSTVVTLKQRFQFLMKLFWFNVRWIWFCRYTPRRRDILKENTLTEIHVKK